MIALTAADIQALYPAINERGLENYLTLANREMGEAFQDVIRERRARGECLLQPDIRGGKPWTGTCLTHLVADTMDHHFEVHPDASND